MNDAPQTCDAAVHIGALRPWSFRFLLCLGIAISGAWVQSYRRCFSVWGHPTYSRNVEITSWKGHVRFNAYRYSRKQTFVPKFDYGVLPHGEFYGETYLGSWKLPFHLARVSLRVGTSSTLLVPHWLLLLFPTAAAFAGKPTPRFSFSLKGLLASVTLFIAVLGAIEAAALAKL